MVGIGAQCNAVTARRAGGRRQAPAGRDATERTISADDDRGKIGGVVAALPYLQHVHPPAGVPLGPLELVILQQFGAAAFGVPGKALVEDAPWQDAPYVRLATSVAKIAAGVEAAARGEVAPFDDVRVGGQLV